MDDLYRCDICFLDYDNVSHKPCIGRCGHTICEKCASDERCNACPICRRGGSFEEVIVNFGLMSVMEYNNQKKKEDEEKKKQLEGTCNLCKKESMNLAICIDCSLKDGILVEDCSTKNQTNELIFKWNTLSQDLAKCIQKAKSSSICADCSITSIHNGHRIGGFKGIQKSIFDKTFHGFKEDIESYLKSFDIAKEEIINNLDKYRNNLVKYLDFFTQLTYDKIVDYYDRVSVFLDDFKDLSKDLTNCNQHLTGLMTKVEDKLKVDSQIATAQDKFYHLSVYTKSIFISWFDLIKNTMNFEPTITAPSDIAAVYYKDNVYIVGSSDEDYMKTVEVYNVVDKTRRKLAPLHEGRFDAEIEVHNGKIIVCGGWNDGANVQTVEEYDIEKNKWTIIGKSGISDSDPSIVSMNGDLYVIGHNRAIVNGIKDKPYLIIEKYNKSKSAFVEITRRDPFMLLIKSCAHDGKIFFVGHGLIRTVISSIKVWTYNPASNEWSEFAPFVKEKDVNVKIYSRNGQLYLVDGGTVEVFDSRKNKWNLIWEK